MRWDMVLLANCTLGEDDEFYAIALKGYTEQTSFRQIIRRELSLLKNSWLEEWFCAPSSCALPAGSKLTSHQIGSARKAAASARNSYACNLPETAGTAAALEREKNFLQFPEYTAQRRRSICRAALRRARRCCACGS